MKLIPYTFIAIFVLGVTSGVATAQQDTGRTLHTGKTAAPRQLNVTPVPLAPVSVVGEAPAQEVTGRTPTPINSHPVRLDPVHIVASRIDPHVGGIMLNMTQIRAAHRLGGGGIGFVIGG